MTTVLYLVIQVPACIALMAFGTALVVSFPDPMVESLGAIRKRLGISSFYVSFVLAPFASYASELLRV